MTLRIGVVAAMEPELEALAGRRVRTRAREHLPGTMLGYVSGLGSPQVRSAAQHLLDAGATALVSWGCAAALSPTIAAGTLFLPRTIVAQDGTVFVPDADWHQAICERVGGFSAQIGPLAESGALLETVEQKRALATASGAVVADMESAVLARVALDAHVPFMVVRAVSDPAGVAVPKSLARAVASDGRIAAGSAMAALAFTPWNWLAAFRLGIGFRAALATLRRAAQDIFETASVSGAPEPPTPATRTANGV